MGGTKLPAAMRLVVQNTTCLVWFRRSQRASIVGPVDKQLRSSGHTELELKLGRIENHPRRVSAESMSSESVQNLYALPDY